MQYKREKKLTDVVLRLKIIAIVVSIQSFYRYFFHVINSRVVLCVRIVLINLTEGVCIFPTLFILSSFLLQMKFSSVFYFPMYTNFVQKGGQKKFQSTTKRRVILLAIQLMNLCYRKFQYAEIKVELILFLHLFGIKVNFSV